MCMLFSNFSYIKALMLACKCLSYSLPFYICGVVDPSFICPPLDYQASKAGCIFVTSVAKYECQWTHAELCPASPRTALA